MKLITTEKDCLKTHLSFLRDVTTEPIAVESIKRAVSRVAPLLHVQKVVLTMRGGASHIVQKEHDIFYENPDEEPLDEAKIDFTFKIDERMNVFVELYPYGCEFTEMDKNALEIYTMESCFVYERAQLNTIVERISMTQYLTRLPNANGYMNIVGRIMNSGNLKIYSAFYFNLKGFGNTNKRFGQKLGDELIRRYAAMLESQLEEDEYLGHLGGDNFTALIKKKNRDRFIELIGKAEIDIEFEGEIKTVKMPATAGVWDINEDINAPGEVISRTAVALNYAKSVTHQPAEILTRQIMEQVVQQKNILEMFKESLINEEFVVFYQPKVDSRTKEIVGSEALVRWISFGNVIPPGMFIPTLERNGEMLPLDYYVLDRVCADLRMWIDKGLDPVPVSVNFSRTDLVDPKLTENIANIIKKHNIDERYLEVEVTETSDIGEQEQLTAFIDSLDKNGIDTAIDDFGVGYSSLSTLRQFNVKTLKIDRSFINGKNFSEKDEVILKDIIHMAGSLDMVIISEGVEREDQLKLVNDAGCYIIQGFLYDKPLPKETYVKRLINRKYK